jgi:hypothetical protein
MKIKAENLFGFWHNIFFTVVFYKHKTKWTNAYIEKSVQFKVVGIMSSFALAIKASHAVHTRNICFIELVSGPHHSKHHLTI